jgi:uncharacterized protein involved in exopolysaccharide biosynthesis
MAHHAPPAAARNLLQKLLTGFGQSGRWVRYFLLVALGGAVFLTLGATYYVVTPRSYVSGFTLILPGSGAGASVNLESLGQTSTMTASAFSSPSLSPTQNYKRLLNSDRVRQSAAETLGVTISDLPTVSVRLVDQTPLIYARLSDSSPDEAVGAATAVLAAFQDELDALREEELDARDAAYRGSLDQYEANVAATQEAVIEFQSRTGLISLEQFQAVVRETANLENAFNDQRDSARNLFGRANELSRLVDLPAAVAARVLVLRGDPEFEAIRRALAETASEIAGLRRMYGANHPEMRQAVQEHAGLVSSLRLRGEALLGVEGYQSLRLADINIEEERANILRQIVEYSAEASGTEAQARSIGDRLERNRIHVHELSSIAAELDTLLRAHQVAETVFASALARLDTSRADIFASYPLAQVLEAPGRPDRASSPSKKVAVLAAFGGFFVYCLGVLLLWLRLPLIRALWKIV